MLNSTLISKAQMKVRMLQLRTKQSFMMVEPITVKEASNKVLSPYSMPCFMSLG